MFTNRYFALDLFNSVINCFGFLKPISLGRFPFLYSEILARRLRLFCEGVSFVFSPLLRPFSRYGHGALGSITMHGRGGVERVETLGICTFRFTKEFTDYTRLFFLSLFSQIVAYISPSQKKHKTSELWTIATPYF